MQSPFTGAAYFQSSQFYPMRMRIYVSRGRRAAPPSPSRVKRPNPPQPPPCSVNAQIRPHFHEYFDPSIHTYISPSVARPEPCEAAQPLTVPAVHRSRAGLLAEELGVVDLVGLGEPRAGPDVLVRGVLDARPGVLAGHRALQKGRDRRLRVVLAPGHVLREEVGLVVWGWFCVLVVGVSG